MHGRGVGIHIMALGLAGWCEGWEVCTRSARCALGVISTSNPEVLFVPWEVWVELQGKE